MKKLLASVVAVAFIAIGSGCATKPYTGQTWYASCKINPNAVYPDEVTGEPTKCTDKLTIRKGSYSF